MSIWLLSSFVGPTEFRLIPPMRRAAFRNGKDRTNEFVRHNQVWRYISPPDNSMKVDERTGGGMADARMMNSQEIGRKRSSIL
jgi:hypothetical protein